MSTEAIILICLHVFILAALVIDLKLLRRRSHTIGMLEAAVGSAIWVCLALVFAFGLWLTWDRWHPQRLGDGNVGALEFITGYLIELTLSIDNLFVFMVIFRFFGVPEGLRHRVLWWGILGAVVARATFIVAGVALLHLFSWMTYVFGAILLYTAFKLSRSVEEEIDPSRNIVFRVVRRLFPIIDNYESHKFWVRREGRLFATPLSVVLLVVESTDVLFAFDSIPAVLGITGDPFIAYTSNIFAILGLRSLYFLLSGFLGMFRYLSAGLAVVLAFVGVKMMTEEWLNPFLSAHGIGKIEKILISLGVIAVILTVSILASVIAGPKEPLEHPPEEPL